MSTYFNNYHTRLKLAHAFTSIVNKNTLVLVHSAKIKFIYYQVEVPASPGKWQRQHEQTNFRQLSFMRENKKTNNRASKEKAQKLARRIPVEMLAKERMNDNQVI